MAFKRVIVLIQVGVASLHRRQAHEQNLHNETKTKQSSLGQTNAEWKRGRVVNQ